MLGVKDTCMGNGSLTGFNVNFIQWTIPLKEAASLLRNFYRDPLQA